jgi:hypothetical protein
METSKKLNRGNGMQANNYLADKCEYLRQWILHHEGHEALIDVEKAWHTRRANDRNAERGE